MFEGEEQQAPPPAANVSFRIKKMRINRGKGKHRDLLGRAIQDWRKRMAGNINNIKGCRECYEFAKNYGIPPQTFYKYIKPTNPRILGDGSRGKRSGSQMTSNLSGVFLLVLIEKTLACHPKRQLI
jgi:hypothetical protein